MDKKRTMLVVCGNPPSTELAECIARLEGKGFTIVHLDRSDSHSDTLAGHEADYVIYNEVGPVRYESEALDRLLDIGVGNSLFPGSIDSKDSCVRTSLSKCVTNK